jgi:hypothetical protein
MIIAEEEATDTKKDAAANTSSPSVNTRFRPFMSASLPRGTKNIAANKRYAVTTQLNRKASMANSLPIVGRAMLTAEMSKGVIKAASVTMNKTALLSSAAFNELNLLPVLYRIPYIN